MSRKTIVPKSVGREIRSFDLGRTFGNCLYAALQHDLPHQWADKRSNRLASDERCYETRVVLEDKGTRLLFVVIVDDTTSPDHLFVVAISKPIKI